MSKRKHAWKLAAAGFALSILLGHSTAFAQVENTASGSIAGAVDSVTSGSITLTVNTLQVRKEAYDLAGNLIAANNGTGSVAKGQTIYVYIYLENVSTGQIDDLRLEDNLNDRNGDGTAGDATGLSFVDSSLQYAQVTGTPTYASIPWTAPAGTATVSGTGTNAIIRLGLDRTGTTGSAYNLPAGQSVAIRFRAVVQ